MKNTKVELIQDPDIENKKNIKVEIITEYFYLLKNENTNKYYFGQTKKPGQRLSAHQAKGFKFTHYCVVPVSFFVDSNGETHLSWTSKEIEEAFIKRLYFHQLGRDSKGEEYEKQHFDEYWERHERKEAKLGHGKGLPFDHFIDRFVYETEVLDACHYTKPHFDFGIDWWQNGKGYSSIQSFEKQDLLEYLQQDFETSSIQEVLGLRWFQYHARFPLMWTEYKKYYKYNIPTVDNVVLADEPNFFSLGELLQDIKRTGIYYL